MQTRRLLGRDGVVGGNAFADGPGIGKAHELADVLHLPPPSFPLGNAPRFEHCIAQILRQVDRSELLVIERDKRSPEILQLVHLALALGFTGKLVRHEGRDAAVS
jgi:hypothetical protein